HCDSVPRSESESQRSGHSAGVVDRPVPLLYARTHAEGDHALPVDEDGVTRDAIRALAQAGFSRRDFLKSSGVLIVSFAAADTALVAGLVQGRGGDPGQFGTRASHVDASQLDSWIAISADGTVTAYTGKCELGQGILTAQTQLVAEELSVPIAKVKL